MTGRVALGAVVVTALTLSVGAASAAPRDPVAADRLFRHGQELMAAGDYAKACVELADSYGLDQTLGTLLNLAFCHEKQGRIFTAVTEYRAVEREAARSEQNDRATFARGRRHELEARLPRARLVLAPGVRATRVLVDDQPIEDDIAAEFYVPPGPHRVVLVLASGARAEKSFSFPDAPKGTTLLHFDDGAVSVGSPPSEPGPPSADGGGSGQRILGLGLVGAGVVVLGVGGYFGLATYGKKDDALGHCDPQGCDAQGKHDGDQAHTFATLATIFVPVGIGLAGLGAYIALTAPPTDRRPHGGAGKATSSRLTVTPGGLHLSGSF